MTQEQPSALSFNLEEAIWLDQGERIQSILGLELEPDITMQEDNHEVLIKGGLHLVGQYQPYENNEDDTYDDQRQGGVPQTADRLSTTDTGAREIKHFFPVDVTIPLHRIQSLDDLYVQIDSFDYDLPEPSCIQLTADVTITGMKEGEDTKREASPTPEGFPTFTHEVKAPPTNDENVHPSSDDTDALREEITKEELEEDQESTPVLNFETQETEPDREIETPVQEEQSDAEVQKEPVPEEVQQTEESVLSRDDADHSNAEPEQEESEYEVVQANDEEEEVEDVSSTDDEETPKTNKRDNALYLTEMLGSDDRESFTKMRMCIIQENESLDTIADRYGYTVQQLLRWNKMDINHVDQGEIIYIPVQSANE
ncbi:stage VI sporulation protein D [Salicibibacter cibarius]|uniref:Stage VI sporulation protein D n=1 Tax=Salicibibacter cibarius TaxID=2743000 RepID=A0A7T6Z580_9BACI|nr:stage VI sporulation protein D [Salicibibacter cibarius]QQK77124.1 stage VI sporulation protein D [Salicibibacter cibarius]